jgi:N-acylneuraminate cytidylyltransferase
MKQIIFLLIALIISCNNQSEVVNKNILAVPDFYPVEPKEYVGSEPMIVLMGDSRIDFMDVPKYFPGRHVINIAKGGTSSANTLYRVQFITKYDPDVVFVSVGVNNIMYGNAGSFQNHIKAIIQEVQNTCPSAVVYVAKLVPVYGDPFKNSIINTMNNGLEGVVTDLGAIYVDTSDMEDVNGLKQEYTVDGVHYSESGYDKLSEIIHRYFI